MKLTYNLCVLISLVSLSFCQVEVWIDIKFRGQIQEFCKIFADNKQAPQSNFPTSDMVVNDSSHITDITDLTQAGMKLDASEKAESTQSLDLQVSGAFKKCNGSLKEVWETLSPAAPNIITINGKMFLFIIYLKSGNFIFPEILVGEHMLFTRYIYKSAPHLFRGTHIDNMQQFIEDFRQANLLIPEMLDKSINKNIKILRNLKKVKDNKDLVDYIHENLALRLFCQWLNLKYKIMDLNTEIKKLKADDEINKKIKLKKRESHKNEQANLIITFRNVFDLVSKEKMSYFKAFLQSNNEYLNDNKAGEKAFLHAASELVRGDFF
jgi:hypothetical protein